MTTAGPAQRNWPLFPPAAGAVMRVCGTAWHWGFLLSALVVWRVRGKLGAQISESVF